MDSEFASSAHVIIEIDWIQERFDIGDFLVNIFQMLHASRVLQRLMSILESGLCTDVVEVQLQVSRLLFTD